MPNPVSTFRNYFRFRTGEKPREVDLNAGLVDKIDADVNQAINGMVENTNDIEALSTRMDGHSDAAGNLTAAPPEFSPFPGGVPTPNYVAANQFYVSGNYTSVFTVNRSIKAALVGAEPISAVKVVVFDAGTNRTTITIWDSVLDATITAVLLGFIQYSLPKIDLGSLAFDPATQAELNTHAAGADHDARYLSKVNTALQVMIGALRIQAPQTSTSLQIEDTTQPSNAYRLLSMQNSSQIGQFYMVRPDTGAFKGFLQFDAVGNQNILFQKLNANNQAIQSLPGPVNPSDAARLVDVQGRVLKTGDAMTGPLTIYFNGANIGLFNTAGAEWLLQALNDFVFYRNIGSHGAPNWNAVYTLNYGSNPVAGTDLTHKGYVDAQDTAYNNALVANDAAVLNAANAHADGQAAAAITSANGYTDSQIAAANGYTNSQIAAAFNRAAGSAASSGGTMGVTMNRYSFFPSITGEGATAFIGMMGGTSDPGNAIGRFQIPSNTQVRWEYFTASDDPTIWIALNGEGEIIGVWASDDPVPNDEPGISGEGLSVFKVKADKLDALQIEQSHIDAARELIKNKKYQQRHELYRALQLKTNDPAPAKWILDNCKVRGGKLVLK